ncbi:hypothetical protein PK28_11990 [Hymenobacter sp. DG25B]|uniref:hypothetical protein n=1 Tax=Hymenobacter sp. DG25B TaxID=1385664 RepID=UPI00054108E6|nr:hypothetical protein [Hymenobacter sp. DG25B]AIZ64226.1 hypothetical protein PK28_11990 [Hymenobacter sp. DG25B]
MRTLSRLSLFLLLSAGLLSGCAHEEAAPACATLVTVRDLTGLDGCRMVLELEDGQRLEPHGSAWQAYTPHDGEQLYVAYEYDSMVSICMVGETVRITCIQPASTSSPQN